MNIKKLYREIPYNYTSFSDKEIILRILGERAWEILESLRSHRHTGLSAHMLLEVLGDMWIVMRNPYIQDDLMENQGRRKSLIDTMNQRLDNIQQRAYDNHEAMELVEHGRRSVKEFGITEPSKILDKTRELVIETFAKSDEDVKDGMDIALCAFKGEKLVIMGKFDSVKSLLINSGFSC